MSIETVHAVMRSRFHLRSEPQACAVLLAIVVDFSLGQVLTSSGPSGYFFAFLLAGLAYVVTLGIVHLLMPKMTPLDDQLRRTGSSLDQ